MMKLFLKVFLLLVLITITSCEQQDVSDETTIELQAADKDRIQSPGGQSGDD